MKTKATKTQPTIGEDIARFVVGAIFVVMTMAFLTVPYVLSSHPGEVAPQAANTSVQRAG